MNTNNEENTNTTQTKSKKGFLSLIFGLFGIFLTYWAVKKSYLYTVVFIKFTSETQNIPGRVLGEALAPIVGYIIVAIFGLLIIRVSFKKS